MVGIVTKIQAKKSRKNRSYGFITSENITYWFPLTGNENLLLDDVVTFEKEENEKGNVAIKIKKVI